MTETKNDEEDTARQFEDEDYEGVVFIQDDVLCNLQEKAAKQKYNCDLYNTGSLDIPCKRILCT